MHPERIVKERIFQSLDAGDVGIHPLLERRDGSHYYNNIVLKG